MNKKISIIIPIVLIIILVLVYRCKTDPPPPKPDKNTKLADSAIVDPFVISKVNFYFENSASMAGYLNGTNFKQVMHRVIGNIQEDKLNSYFVNSKEHPVENILSLIDNRKTAVGDISTSDHQFIFSNAIQNVGSGELGIVVTDGIYSVKQGDIDIVEIEIENTFKKALENNELETVVLKLVSEFDGIYYSETCAPSKKAIKIKQDRPYYILLFGNKNVINKALKTIAITEELPGFAEQARFLLTKYEELNYTILSNGEEKHGKFRKENREKLVKTIKDAEKFSIRGLGKTGDNDTYLQFGIAVDYSKMDIPDSYLRNIENYKLLGETGFVLDTIKAITDLSKNTQTSRSISREFKDYNLTHILVVRAEKDFYGQLVIELENNLPEWIKETGISDDCNIIGNTQSTYAFDKLIKGISQAYKKINNNEAYFNLELKINP